MKADPLTLRRRPHRRARIGERHSISSGSSIKIVARSQRSVEDERELPGRETHAPRTREASPLSLPGNPQGVDVQLKEDIKVGGEESDSPIVLRDGRADHMGKGRAEKQREQSTHGGIGLIPVPVSSSLLAIGNRFGHDVDDAGSIARFSEEPGAGKPHAGICEGGAR